ncbi:inositol hexakisphosphate and diphosphoinositol-pentakisphosphate kinase 2-like isoform X2 [Ylistrum balloti]|uniref:inositol hexakisphosphate and diphosphoinositol-pentakisphosphate kinase 2-like isoform X2 n=1 Tax=Ylistrum balloti TaxID=509963 RepID=UPI0029057EAC|nr:inositol hexakisphosphate and diphosphoinositol-pentakisphosphate kinase 2-like isoform X2 [Ylistrum balloti]
MMAESECGYLRMDDQENRPIFVVGDDSTFSQLYMESHEDIAAITVGVCAMAKKCNSKPMREILQRLELFEHIKTLVFEEDVILNHPIEDWPVVDVLISFFSQGFPLDKAIAYKNLRKPYIVNDLEAQKILLDRRLVYEKLEAEGIIHPRYAILNREGNGTAKCQYTDAEDCIEVNGVVFHKPFVEKPVSAEDHNVYIYFPVAAGGGSQRLFRKVGPRSSAYYQVNRVRQTGSYIYEDFMPTDGTDVKVYTVGPDYAHAEARKSPALDGKVERDKDGKEVRFPVILSAKEKLLARKVCQAFKQNVCGFDLLRASGKSYVCDVNGFSFVKNSIKYYDDCAKILGTMIMRALAPQRHIPWVLGAAPEDIPVVPTTSGSMMELRTVVAVIRHGDRTPKQKMKMEVKHKKFFDLFKKYDGYRNGHLKLKKPKQLQEVLDIARFLLSEQQSSSDPEIAEKKAKLQQLKLVLEMWDFHHNFEKQASTFLCSSEKYGHFSGINRKVQLKYQPYGHPKKSSSEEDLNGEIEHCSFDECDNCENNDSPRQPSLLLIVKWGGELTPAGKIQAEDLGKAFRTLYPGGQGQFETPGLGFLRLHSTFRHDLKIYASDEGRVQMTAAAFAKGLLALEGELTPILVQMVKSANTNGLLDKQGETSKYQHIVKERLMSMLNVNKEFDEVDYEKLAPTRTDSLSRALKYIYNPQKMCRNIHDMVKELTAQIRRLKMEHRHRELKLYNGESWELLIRRWAKLEKDFRMKDGRFDISKIPDIYDCIKYDLQHNQSTLQIKKAEDLFKCSRAMADIVIPQEYGITVGEKQHISQSLCTPLMRKIRSDLQQCVCPFEDEEGESTRLNSKYSNNVASPERFVRTRLYFTSESHIHSLLNMLRYGGLCGDKTDSQWSKAMDYVSELSELNYMTQIVIMMFEDPSKEISSDERFHVELHFSPGAYTCGEKILDFPVGRGYHTLSKKEKRLSTGDDTNETNEQVAMDTLTPGDDGQRMTYVDRPRSAQMVIQETLEELQEADIFDHHGNTETSKPLNKEDMSLAFDKSKTKVPEPKSPDPSVPEWDWGDDDQKSRESVTDELDNKSPTEVTETDATDRDGSVPSSGGATPVNTSQPIEIQASRPKEPVRSQSFEEKRSRSLEDKHPEVKEHTALIERHYLTVHLPLASDHHRRSWSSIFCLGTDSLKAFGGFNMVPSLRPLETLHNKLTMRDMDLFFGRVTTTKFTPVSSPPYGSSSNTPVVSPRPPAFLRGTGISLPSSSNSSAGPSSPTSGSTPVDLVSQLRLYIKEIDSGQSEMLTGQSETDTSQSNEPTENKTDKPCHVAPNTEGSKSGDQYTGNRFKVSQTEQGAVPARCENTQSELTIPQTNCQSDQATSEGREKSSDSKSKQTDVGELQKDNAPTCENDTDIKDIETKTKLKSDKFVIDSVTDESHCCK